MDDCPHRADARLVAPVPIALALKTVAGGAPFAQGSTDRFAERRALFADPSAPAKCRVAV